MTGGWDGGQAEYARVPFGEFALGVSAWANSSSQLVLAHQLSCPMPDLALQFVSRCTPQTLLLVLKPL